MVRMVMLAGIHFVYNHKKLVDVNRNATIFHLLICGGFCLCAGAEWLLDSSTIRLRLTPA